MNPTTILIVITIVVVAVVLFARPLAARMQRSQVRDAASRFRIQREQLEARFFDMASQLGKPRDVRWVDCDWQPDVTYARDRESGMLTAFVAVNIQFEAIDGGDMEDVEFVKAIRDAAAVFHFKDGSWGTGGRALFNMNPVDAVARLQEQYEPLSESGESLQA